jgi:hypothetical protein
MSAGIRNRWLPTVRICLSPGGPPPDASPYVVQQTLTAGK